MQKRYLYNPQTDLIGKGGSADVYKAYDNNLKRFVAIKRCSSGATSNKSVLKEIAGYCDLKHQNIIQYYDYFDETITDSFGGTQNIEYGVMEYANNGNFTQIVNKSIKVTEEEFKELLTGILDGLDYLHGNNEWNRTIMHRDLKPGNILLNKTDNKLVPKICDFGISKTTYDNIADETGTIQFSTPEYSAPEQINSKKFGVNGKIKSNVDFWALGCTVYEYFTGKAPFGKRSDGTLATEIQNNILDAEPDYPSSIPPLYKKIIKHCLVKNASDRICNATDLKQILAGKLINTNKSPDNKLIKWVFILKLAILLLLTISGTFFFLNNSKKNDSQKDVQKKIEDTTIEVQPLDVVQNSKDELSSIIKTLLLEKNADISYYNWSESNNTNLPVEWKTDNVVESNKYQQEYGMYKRDGKFVPKINGNICYSTYFDYDIQKTDWINTKIELSSSWNIILFGNRNGFSYVDISSETAPEMESIDVLEYLKKELGLVFISGNEEEGLYRINTNNYKQSELKYWKSCGSAGCSVGIEINLLSDESNTNDWRTNTPKVSTFIPKSKTIIKPTAPKPTVVKTQPKTNTTQTDNKYGTVTDIDGNVYKTVKIGNQIWMAENLKTTRYNDGTSIPNVTDNNEWSTLTTGAYCYYDNDYSNNTIYGKLYNWYAVETSKFAPKGWHVPSAIEWDILVNYLGGINIANVSNIGGKMKSTSYWENPNIGATNSSGFTGLPAGYRINNGTFNFTGKLGYFWSSTNYGLNMVTFCGLYNNTYKATKYGVGKESGLSIRCIKD